MHFAISASWGPTDPTRAMLPFIFAASALQVKDKVTIMLFHDAVHLASRGVAKDIVINGKTGFRVPVFDTLALSEKIKEMYLKTNEERRLFTDNCVELARKFFSKEVAASKIVELIK